MKQKTAETNAIIGKSLQKARKSRKVIQQDMCFYCDLSKNHISSIERGNVSASINTLLGYCECLKMSPNEVLGYEKYTINDELMNEIKTMSKEEQRKLLEIARIIKR